MASNRGFALANSLQREIRITLVKFHIRYLTVTEVGNIGLLIQVHRICKTLLSEIKFMPAGNSSSAPLHVFLVS